MEGVSEVRYAGVVLGRAAELRDLTASGVFVSLPEPLPVGTSLLVKIDDKERAARVVEVVESADPAVAGMRVQFVSEAGSAREPSRPAPAATPPAPAPAAAAPPPPAEPAATHGKGDGKVEAQVEGASGPTGGSTATSVDGAPDGAGRRRRRRR